MGLNLALSVKREGGAEHCMADNSSMAVDHMADWVAEMLGGNPKGVKSGAE